VFEYIFLLVIAFLLSVLFTFALRKVARRLGVIDLPDGYRKLHQGAVPRLGGVGIHLAFFLAIAWYLFRGGPSLAIPLPEVLALLVGASAVLLLGVWDDVSGVKARHKILAVAAVATFMYFAGYRIGAIGNPFGESLSLGIFALPVTVFWFVACCSALNLIDGLDGLAAGVVLFASVVLFFMSLIFGNPWPAAVTATLAGAVLGFLLFNFPPASIFLGDSGSLLLGFLIAAIGLKGAEKSSTVVALIAPTAALGLPLMDTALAVIRRWSKAIPVSVADRGHIHHRLLSMGFSRRKAVLMLYILCLAFGGVGLLMTAAKSVEAAVVLGALALLVFITVRLLGWSDIIRFRKRITTSLASRRRVVEARRAADIASTKISSAESLPRLWRAFEEALGFLDLDYAELALVGRFKGADKDPTFLWKRGGSAPGQPSKGATRWQDCWSGIFTLRLNGTTLGHLSVRKDNSRGTLTDGIPEMLESIKEAIEKRLPTLIEGFSSPEGRGEAALSGAPTESDSRTISHL